MRAPFAGVVIAKSAQPGEMISPISAGGGFTRTGIGTIVDMDSLEIQVDVNEAFINRVKPGQPVEAMLNAYPDWKIPGEVIAIIPTADRSKATVKVRIALKHAGSRASCPTWACAWPSSKQRRRRRRAARAAACWCRPRRCARRATQGVVFVVADGKVERRTRHARAGRVGADRQVLSGLAPASAWCCRRRSRCGTAPP